MSNPVSILAHVTFRSRNLTFRVNPKGFEDHPLFSLRLHSVPRMASTSDPTAALNQEIILVPVLEIKKNGVRSWSLLKDGTRRLHLDDVPPSVAKALGGEAFRGTVELTRSQSGEIHVKILTQKKINEINRTRRSTPLIAPATKLVAIQQLRDSLDTINQFLSENPGSEFHHDSDTNRIKIKIVL